MGRWGGDMVFPMILNGRGGGGVCGRPRRILLNRTTSTTSRLVHSATPQSTAVSSASSCSSLVLARLWSSVRIRHPRRLVHSPELRRARTKLLPADRSTEDTTSDLPPPTHTLCPLLP